MPKLLFTFIFVAVLTGCRPVPEKPRNWLSADQPFPDTLTWQLRLADPEQQALLIKNTSEKPAVFRLNVNDRFYLNRADIRDLIIARAEAAGDSVLPRAAWDFMAAHSFHGRLQHVPKYMYLPEILVNSTGFGFCSERATALALLWQEMGWPARVWDLGGHVVPEVKMGDRWAMFDPDHILYFSKTPDAILSVRELEVNLEWGPESREGKIPKYGLDAYAAFSVLSKAYDALFSTTDDNSVNNWYLQDTAELPDLFILPPQSSLRLFTTTAIRTVDSDNQIVSALEVLLRPGSKGPLFLPLVLARVEGQLTLKKNEKILYEPQSELIPDSNMTVPFEISDVQDTARLYFLVNPHLNDLERDNEVLLTGRGLAGMEIDLGKRPLGLPFVPGPISPDFMSGYHRFREHCRVHDLKPVRLEELGKFFQAYLDSREDLKENEKAREWERYQRGCENLMEFMGAYDRLSNTNKLIEKNPDAFYLVVYMMEHIDYGPFSVE